MYYLVKILMGDLGVFLVLKAMGLTVFVALDFCQLLDN